MTCRCAEPRESADPRHKGICCVCGHVIDPSWTLCDETVRTFFDYLEQMPGLENFPSFRHRAEAREREGRRLYGHRHLARDPIEEGQQEACDGPIYSLSALLQARRAGEEEPFGPAFEAAYHFARAYAALARARHPD